MGMKAVILAGGMGTRLSEETSVRPKPMLEIGGRPILWHIMKLYSVHGVNDFIICCGYKGYIIKEYFANYFLHMSDVTFDISDNRMEVHQQFAEPWRVTLVDTGVATQTGGRLKRVRRYLGDEDFCLTYGDGVADVDIGKLVEFHKREGKLATVTAIQPRGGSVCWISMVLWSAVFRKSPEGRVPGSMAGFSCCPPRWSTTSKVMRRHGNRSPWRAWRRKGS